MSALNLPDMAISSSVLIHPRRIMVSMSREDLDALNLALVERRDFTFRGGEVELVFTRREGYWLC